MVSHHLSYCHLVLGVGAENKGTTMDVVGNIEAYIVVVSTIWEMVRRRALLHE